MSKRYFLLLVSVAVVFIFITTSFLTISSKKNTQISSNRQFVENNAQENSVSIKIILGGDVMLGRSVYKQIKRYGFKYPFQDIKYIFDDADIVFVNLENPIVRNCPLHEGGFKFCSGYEAVDSLKYAGISIVNLANNHIANYGQAGIDETISILNNNNILYTGFGNLAIKRFNNLSIGFLGFDFTVKNPTENDYRLIVDSKKDVDLLIVAVHWGVEYTNSPTDYQRQWAKKIAESGADVIVGHHPHWIQEQEQVQVQVQEKTKNVPVFYSLGNLVFDQMWSEETKKGLLVELIIEKDSTGNWKMPAPNRMILGEIGNYFNTYIKNLGQPIILQDSK